ncbi:MAG: hypothetical protein U0R69_08990 [Gaiellales bacterium]
MQRVLADVVLDPVEMVEEDLPEVARRHLLLGELPADEVGAFTRSWCPLFLVPVLVLGLVEQGAFSHRPEPEEAVAIRLAAVEEQEGRRTLEVVAPGVVLKLLRGTLQRCGRVELCVALDLAEHDRGRCRSGTGRRSALSRCWSFSRLTASVRCSRKCSPSASEVDRSGYPRTRMSGSKSVEWTSASENRRFSSSGMSRLGRTDRHGSTPGTARRWIT